MEETKMGKSKQVACYCRCSTDKQDISLQQNELQRYADRRDWNITWFIDEGESGSKVHRPSLDDMMNQVRKGNYDVVMVWKFDRFARSLTQLLSALNEFSSLNVDFVSVTESIDTTSPAGKLLFQMLGAVAEFERSLIRERVRAGIKNTTKRLGRPRASFDYRRAVELRKNGMSLRRIAKELGTSLGTINRVLSNVA